MISSRTLSLLGYFTYILIDINYRRLGEHVMVLWNLLYGGLSRKGPLLGPSESLQGDILGTNPHHSAVGPRSATRSPANEWPQVLVLDHLHPTAKMPLHESKQWTDGRWGLHREARWLTKVQSWSTLAQSSSTVAGKLHETVATFWNETRRQKSYL
jgi:hypothetical protein